MPLWMQMSFYGLCFMYANVDAMQSLLFFVYVDDMIWGNVA